MSAKVRIKFGNEGRVLDLRGREAWAILKLIAAGEVGCTPFNTPAHRFSHYIFKLRGYGIPVETINEMHGGQFPGRHARYVLRMPIEVIEQTEAA